MSRSGYSDELDDTWAFICWRGAVQSAIKGKRGQKALQEILTALDAMPVKELIKGELESEGAVCTLGALGQYRHLDLTNIDPYDSETVAETFGIAPALAKEIMFENDEDFCFSAETTGQRWQRMRTWVASLLRRERG